jgi:hypothetical protein
LVDYQLYFVVYNGVLQAIRTGGVARLTGIQCLQGEPVVLYDERGAIRGPVERCVCLLLQDLVQSCLRGEGGILEDMCHERRRAGKLCERRRGRRRRKVREGACIGAATMLQPWTLRLILNAAALAAASPTLLSRPW